MKIYLIYLLKIMMFIYITFIIGCVYNEDCTYMELTGSIIMPTPDNSFGTSDFNGLVKYNIKDRNGILILDDLYCLYPCYSISKNKIMFIGWDNYLYEYDFNIGKLRNILVENGINYPKYVPNSNCISYIKDYKMVIYNLEDTTKKEIDNVTLGEYSWSNDGKSFVYNKDVSGNHNIYKYNLEDDTSISLFKGSCPIYSIDNKYIAYFPGSLYGEIAVRNMETGEEKKTREKGCHYFKFSPKGDKLAYMMSSGKYEDSLIIWDYATNKTCTLLERIKQERGFEWIKN